MLLVVVSAVAISAKAFPLLGTFDGVSTLTPTATPGIFTQSFSGDGVDKTYGSFTASSTSTVDFRAFPIFFITNGMNSLDFANGSLHGTGSGLGLVIGPGLGGFFTHITIAGGTGIFRDASGLVDVFGLADVSGTITTTGPITAAVTGFDVGSWVPVPEPSTVLLVAAGLAGVVWLRRKSSSNNLRSRLRY